VLAAGNVTVNADPSGMIAVLWVSLNVRSAEITVILLAILPVTCKVEVGAVVAIPKFPSLVNLPYSVKAVELVYFPKARCAPVKL